MPAKLFERSVSIVSHEAANTRYLHPLRRWLRGGWDLLLPPVCVLCDAPIISAEISDALASETICADCHQRLASEDSYFCQRCGMPTATCSENSCQACDGRRWKFSSVSHLGEYEGYLREAIILAKQRGAEALAYALGLRLSKVLDDRLAMRPDLVTSVPMHWRRRLARGINTASCTAMAISQQLKIPYAADLLVCRRAIAKQSRLTIGQRRRNVRGAYRLAWGYDIRGAKVLVVDDVMTTGATMQEIAKVLATAQAAEVKVAVIARATGPDW